MDLFQNDKFATPFQTLYNLKKQFSRSIKLAKFTYPATEQKRRKKNSAEISQSVHSIAAFLVAQCPK